MSAILLAAVLLLDPPKTPPAHLDTLAARIEAGTLSNAELNKQMLFVLREPIKTYTGVTLPTTAAQYTQNVETALKLRPPASVWVFAEQELRVTTVGAAGNWYVASFSLQLKPGWVSGGAAGESKISRPMAVSAAIVRAWAAEMRRQGRR